MRDVTERHQAERQLHDQQQQLRQSLADKDVLLKEIHHRVKNNLQVVVAMIDMQMMEYGDTIPVREAERLRGHVNALAALHDLLTRQARESGETESISSTTVLEKLIALLRAASPRAVRLDVHEAPLTVRQATALALILQELVSNSLKHGDGEIEIAFRAEDATAVLEVCDSGSGYPPNFDPRAGSTGMELVDTAIRWDLGGTLQCDNRAEGGARTRIFFPTFRQA